MNKVTISAVVMVVFLAVIYRFYPSDVSITSPADGVLDNFAKCLAEQKVIMYGNYNCPHCQNEKKAFGDSFRFILYIECTQEPSKCVEAGITRVPTWIFSNGEKLIGEQGLQNLSQKSGCRLP